MPTLSELEKWLSTSQAANKLGISRQGALYLVENGHIRGVRTANGWLVDPQSVERYQPRKHEREAQKKSV